VPIKQLWVGLLAAIFLAIGSLRLRLLGIRPLVLLYNLSMPPAIMTILAAKFAGAKVVGMIADLDIPGETVPYSILHRLDYALQRRLIRILDGLLPISDAIAADFFPGRRYVRVSGGIDTSIVDSFAQRRPRDTRVLRVAFAGSLDKANGVEIILEAVTLLKTLDLRVEIAGRGPLEESVRRAALQDSRIAYLGFLGRAEVYEMYKRADVLLNIRLTSANRTPYLFPSKLTEYISAGAYVVTTNVGHAKDLLADRASFLNEETPAALSSLLKQLSEHDPAGLRDQGERCRERVLSELSWTTQGVRIRDYFESLL
jgi:glycosyltransferase involved in cell wall biosynthesis